MHFSFLLSLLSTIVVMQNPLNQQKRKKNELNITEVKEKKKDQRVRLISKQMND
jgi:cytoskeletal protein RodZ